MEADRLETKQRSLRKTNRETAEIVEEAEARKGRPPGIVTTILNVPEVR